MNKVEMEKVAKADAERDELYRRMVAAKSVARAFRGAADEAKREAMAADNKATNAEQLAEKALQEFLTALGVTAANTRSVSRFVSATPPYAKIQDDGTYVLHDPELGRTP